MTVGVHPAQPTYPVSPVNPVSPAQQKRARVKWQVQPHRRAAFSVVVTLMVVSLGVVVVVGFRPGGYCLAASLGLAALMRALLPARWCLGLLVRSRRLDVLMLATLAATLALVVSRVRGTV